MSDNDIKDFGSNDGVGYFWVKQTSSFGSHLNYCAINEFGEIHATSLNKPWDDTARTPQEAVVAHLSRGLDQADADLERRRAEAPEPATDPEPPPDPATDRFFNDDDDPWDLPL